MSREERRAYQRMMKSQERDALPPAARARAERAAARRARIQRPAGDRTAFPLVFWVRSVLIAAAVGLIGFSLQWPNMPFALYVGTAVAVIVLALLVAFRMVGRRRTGPGV